MVYQFPQKPKGPQADIQSWERKEEAGVPTSHMPTAVPLLLAQYHLDFFVVEGRHASTYIAY